MRAIERDLTKLKHVISRRTELPEGICLIWDPEQDRLNMADPRAFCYVLPDDSRIYCAQALDALPRVNGVGILLHEIGHIWSASSAETEADAFAVTMDPGFRYVSSVTYFNPITDSPVMAHSLEQCSEEFVSELDESA